jgi:hypothetical protein
VSAPIITPAARARMLTQACDRIGLRAHHAIGLSQDERERRDAYAAAARDEAAMLRQLAAELESMYAV